MITILCCQVKKRLMAEAFYLVGFIAPGLSRGLNLKKEKIGFSH